MSKRKKSEIYYAIVKDFHKLEGSKARAADPNGKMNKYIGKRIRVRKFHGGYISADSDIILKRWGIYHKYWRWPRYYLDGIILEKEYLQKTLELLDEN